MCDTGEQPAEVPSPVMQPARRGRIRWLIAGIGLLGILLAGGIGLLTTRNAGVDASVSSAVSSPTVSTAMPTGSPVCGRRLGYLGPLSGPLPEITELGASVRDGARLAVEQYNTAHPDCPVQLVEFDDKMDPDAVLTQARAVAADSKLVGVIGPVVGFETTAALPVLDAAGVPVITPTVLGTALSASGWRVFHRAVPNNAVQGAAAARYIRDTLHATKVYVVADETPLGAELGAAVRAGLGTLVVGSVQETATLDVNDIIAQIRASGATAVYFGGSARTSSTLLILLRKAGVNAAFIGSDQLASPSIDLNRLAGGTPIDGAVAICPCHPATDAGFLKAYTTRFAARPGDYAGTAYDLANIYLAGVAHGVDSRERMLGFINAYDGTGVAGRYRFGPTGELDPAIALVSVLQLHHGQFTLNGSESTR